MADPNLLAKIERGVVNGVLTLKTYLNHGAYKWYDGGVGPQTIYFHGNPENPLVQKEADKWIASLARNSGLNVSDFEIDEVAFGQNLGYVNMTLEEIEEFLNEQEQIESSVSDNESHSEEGQETTEQTGGRVGSREGQAKPSERKEPERIQTGNSASPAVEEDASTVQRSSAFTGDDSKASTYEGSVYLESGPSVFYGDSEDNPFDPMYSFAIQNDYPESVVIKLTIPWMNKRVVFAEGSPELEIPGGGRQPYLLTFPNKPPSRIEVNWIMPGTAEEHLIFSQRISIAPAVETTKDLAQEEE